MNSLFLIFLLVAVVAACVGDWDWVLSALGFACICAVLDICRPIK